MSVFLQSIDQKNLVNQFITGQARGRALLKPNAPVVNILENIAKKGIKNLEKTDQTKCRTIARMLGKSDLSKLSAKERVKVRALAARLMGWTPFVFGMHVQEKINDLCTGVYKKFSRSNRSFVEKTLRPLSEKILRINSLHDAEKIIEDALHLLNRAITKQIPITKAEITSLKKNIQKNIKSCEKEVRQIEQTVVRDLQSLETTIAQEKLTKKIIEGLQKDIKFFGKECGKELERFETGMFNALTFLDKEITDIDKNTRTGVKNIKEETSAFYKKCRQAIQKLTKTSMPRQKIDFRQEAALFCNECERVLQQMKKGITKPDLKVAKKNFIKDYRYLKNAVKEEWAKLTKSAK